MNVNRLQVQLLFLFVSDQSDKIKHHLNLNQKTIDLTLDSPINSTSSFLSLKLNVRTDMTTSVLIVINMPELTLEFNKHLFTGKYDPATKLLSLNEDITLKSSGEATLKLSGGKTVFFENLLKSFNLFLSCFRF